MGNKKREPAIFAVSDSLIKTTTEVVVCTRPKRANYRLNP